MRLDTTRGRLPHVAAVYVLTHIASGRRYVGSTADMGKRAEHWRLLRPGRLKYISPVSHLLIRDGPGAFILQVVEHVPDPEWLLDREAWWVAALATQEEHGGLNARVITPGPRPRPLAPAHATIARLAYATGRMDIQTLASAYGVSYATMRRHLLGA